MNFNDAMNEVLKKSRYDFLTGRRVDVRVTIENFINRVLNWVFNNMNFRLPRGTDGNAGMIAVIFTTVAVLCAAVAAFILIRAYFRSRVKKRYDLSDIFAEMKDRTVEELLELSKNADNARIAVRYKYVAVILSLNERDVITIEPSATNAMIYAQLKKTAPVFSLPFSQIADVFHLTWFGHKNVESDVINRFNSAVNKVIFNA